MNINVCIKQVTDPEAPASSYVIDTEAKKVTMKGVPPVISPFDENALEAALRIKDTTECRITVISVGEKLSRPVLLKSLAAGADELYLIEEIKKSHYSYPCKATMYHDFVLEDSIFQKSRYIIRNSIRCELYQAQFKKKLSLKLEDN